MTASDLAARAIALPGWRWLPGMRAQWIDGSWWRVLSVDRDGRPSRVIADDCPPESAGWWLIVDPGAVSQLVAVDLSDPATGGVLLSLLGGAMANVTPTRTVVSWGSDRDGNYAEGCTIGEACCRVALARGRWGA